MHYNEQRQRHCVKNGEGGGGTDYEKDVIVFMIMSNKLELQEMIKLFYGIY